MGFTWIISVFGRLPSLFSGFSTVRQDSLEALSWGLGDPWIVREVPDSFTAV